MRCTVVLVVATAMAACAAPFEPRPAPATVLTANAIMERVVDGDTVVVRIRGHDETVRLIAIDTPETVDQRRPVMCFGKEASAESRRLLPAGTPVRLVRDVEGRDGYDRLLAYVYRATDGLFVNLALAAEGYAQALTIAPNVAHADEVAAAVADARRHKRGLWGVCGSFGVPVASKS
jgi:micrococcal nuclease